MSRPLHVVAAARALLLFTAAAAHAGETMPTRTLVVFSPVHGQLRSGGKPAPGVEVRRRWSWIDVGDGDETTRTDAQGRFSFPAATVRRARVPRDIIIAQDVEVRRDDATVSVWNLLRQNTEENGELGGVPIELLADLDGLPHEVKLPVDGKVHVISGVATFPHPYLQQLEKLIAQAKPDPAAAALKRFFTSTEGLKRLQAYVPAVGKARRAVTGVKDVADVELTEGTLWCAAGSRPCRATEQADVVGFTARARVLLEVDAGPAVEGKFFAWSARFPVDPAGTLTWDVHFKDAWEVDTRPWIREQALAHADPARLAALMQGLLQAQPGERVLEALGVKKARDITVLGLEVSDVKVEGAKDDWAIFSAMGRARIKAGKREETAWLRGYVGMRLDSLDDAAWRPSPVSPPTFAPLRFRVALKTDKARYARGGKIILGFEVENLMGSPQRFLKWHTPFEGFRNDFLEVENTATGAKVEYRGILASRAPPGPEAFLNLAPGEKARSTIDITECYQPEAAGEYVLRFKGLDAVLSNEVRFSVE